MVEDNGCVAGVYSVGAHTLKRWDPVFLNHRQCCKPNYFNKNIFRKVKKKKKLDLLNQLYRVFYFCPLGVLLYNLYQIISLRFRFFISKLM